MIDFRLPRQLLVVGLLAAATAACVPSVPTPTAVPTVAKPASVPPSGGAPSSSTGPAPAATPASEGAGYPAPSTAVGAPTGGAYPAPASAATVGPTPPPRIIQAEGSYPNPSPKP